MAGMAAIGDNISDFMAASIMGMAMADQVLSAVNGMAVTSGTIRLS